MALKGLGVQGQTIGAPMLRYSRGVHAKLGSLQEGGERTLVEACAQRSDIAVNRDGPGLSKLRLAEPAALDGDARQPSSGRRLDVPGAVANDKRCAWVTVAATHRGEKDLGIGFGTGDVIGRRREIDDSFETNKADETARVFGRGRCRQAHTDAGF